MGTEDGAPDAALPLGFATVNLDRTRRQGLPEVIYAPGKEPGQIAAIAAALLDRTPGPVLVTRLEPATAGAVAARAGRRRGAGGGRLRPRGPAAVLAARAAGRVPGGGGHGGHRGRPGG